MMVRYMFVCIPILVLVLMTSWLIALTLEHFSGHHNLSLLSGSMTERQKRFSLRKERIDNGMQMTDKYRNVFTFVQLTDIHISKFRYVTEVTSDMKKLCRIYFPLIKPNVVLLTGDLTDAKAKNNMYSKQYIEEWMTYKKVIDYCNQQFRTTWLDVKGNHDSFGVPNTGSDVNLYQRFGSSGALFNDSRHYEYVVTTDFGKYSFHGLDLTPPSGPKRPFNFFGMLTQEDVESLSTITKDSNQYNLSFWFGHYPLSITTAPSYIRDKVQTGIAYLCGHLHTLGGFVPRMYARSHQGNLELESGDWKENRRYRIMAVDHDLFSFVDKTFPEMPVILITNPKDARFIVPEKEPIERTLKSTHIRFFVFSQLRLIKVAVYIDGKILCKNARKAAESFYVCPWDPKYFKNGLHQLKVLVGDSNHRQSSAEIPFSLDGSTKLMALFPALFMLTDFCFLAKLFYFYTFICIVIWPLCIRYATPKHFFGKIFKIMLRVTPRKIVNFSKMDHLFWPLFKFSVYLGIGPMFIGEIVPNSTGVCFVHGIYANGRWIEESLTYIYGTILLITYNLPIMTFLGQQEMIPKRSNINTTTNAVKEVIRIVKFSGKLLFLLLCILFQIQFCYTIYVCYGLTSFLLSPSALWVNLFGFWLVYQDRRFNSTKCRSTIKE